MRPNPASKKIQDQQHELMNNGIDETITRIKNKKRKYQQKKCIDFIVHDDRSTKTKQNKISIKTKNQGKTTN